MKFITILITNNATAYGGVQILRQAVLFVWFGNQTTYRGNSFTWEQGRKLVSGNMKGKSFAYAYDGNGLRYKKEVNGYTTEYYLNGSQILMENRINNGGRVYYLYDVSGIAGMKYNNEYYYFDKNTLGDVIGIRNKNGTTVATYEYDAWGNITYQSGAMAEVNPFRYRGYYYDTETGFYYLQTRYYDPTICRFINADNYELVATLSSSHELNLYAYANNNPIMLTDETGEFVLSTLLIGALIGFGVSFTSSAIMQAAFNGGEVNWGTALIDGLFGAASGAVGALGISALAVGLINTGLSFANGVITTGIDQNWQFSGMDWGIIAGTSLLSGFISMRFYNQSAVKATNSFTSKIRGRIASGYYGTGARATRSIASATAQANKMVLRQIFDQNFCRVSLITLLQSGVSQAANAAEYYLV